MRVYVLIGSSYHEGCGIPYGIFSTRELAMAQAKKGPPGGSLYGPRYLDDILEIFEYEMDSPGQPDNGVEAER